MIKQAKVLCVAIVCVACYVGHVYVSRYFQIKPTPPEPPSPMVTIPLEDGGFIKFHCLSYEEAKTIKGKHFVNAFLMFDEDGKTNLSNWSGAVVLTPDEINRVVKWTREQLEKK